MRVALALSIVLIAGAAFAAPADDFNRLTTAGVTAEKANDLAAASKAFADADRIIPNYPPVLAERAKVAAMQGDVAGALDLIGRYASTGLNGERFDAASFDTVRADKRWAAIHARFLANAEPEGRLATVAALPGGGAFLAESVAWDQKRQRWLISSVHNRTIVQWDDAGELPFLRATADTPAIFNLAVDAKHDVLWASASTAPQADHYDAKEAGTAALLEIKLGTGEILHRYDAPKADARGFGDLVLASDGTVYVSDGLTGEIWRHKPRAAALDLLVPAGRLTSPQGLVPTPDGKRLIVADYDAGLFSVDRATGAVTRVPAPADAELIWIDGMTHRGRTLIAVQNGTTSPNRVVALTLDPSWRRVTGWRVLTANQPELEQLLRRDGGRRRFRLRGANPVGRLRRRRDRDGVKACAAPDRARGLPKAS